MNPSVLIRVGEEVLVTRPGYSALSKEIADIVYNLFATERWLIPLRI